MFFRGEDQDREPPWTWWITDAELAWYEAMIHVDNEDWGVAVDLFEVTLRGRPPGYERACSTTRRTWCTP